jgi:hypothetical protein
MANKIDPYGENRDVGVGDTKGSFYDSIKVGIGTGLMTGNPWYAIGTIVISSVLQAVTAPKQRREWTGMDALLYDLKKNYTELREKKELAIQVASTISGKPTSYYNGLTGVRELTSPMQGKGALTPADIANDRYADVTQQKIDAKEKALREKTVEPYTEPGKLESPDQPKKNKKKSFGKKVQDFASNLKIG